MLQPHTTLYVHLARRTLLSIPPAYRVAATSRHIASSSRDAAQVQEDIARDAQPSPHRDISTDEPQKLGKRARKAIKARQRQEQERSAKEAKFNGRTPAQGDDAAGASKSEDVSSAADTAGPHPILRVKHVLQESEGPSPLPGTSRQSQEVDQWRSRLKGQDASDPTAGWSGSLFRSHISSLLSGFGTAPNTRPLQESDLPGGSSASTISLATPPTPAETLQLTPSNNDPARPSAKLANKKATSTSPFMTKSERMESQARVIFQAIREARERGMVDEDESFFYPYPEGVPPKDLDGKDAVWLNLGPDPEAWGREIPQVKDKWLEVLSLGLAKEISGRHPAASSTSAGGVDGEYGDTEQARKDELAFDDLVEDFDLEDHERLEQLGDSIVNMSSRLLAYHSYPDVNEGSLTRLSNYPTQNNFLALLFQECGLAARRDELRRELRKARSPDDDSVDADDATPTKRQAKKEGEPAQTEEEKAKLPLQRTPQTCRHRAL